MTLANILANEAAARVEYDVIFRESKDEEPNDPANVKFRTWMIETELRTISRQQLQDHQIIQARIIRPCPCDTFCDCLEWARDQGVKIVLVSG